MRAEIDFDSRLERAGTGCEKFDRRREVFGRADVIPLWVADMDFASPACAREALANRLQHPIYGYHMAPESLGEAFCGWYDRRHQWRIDPADMLWTPGTVPILVAAISALTEPGDRILVPSPVYPPFFEIVKQTGRELIRSPLQRVEGGYHLDFEHLEKEGAAGAKMLLLCSPHNPVGRVWRPQELDRLAEIALRYEMIIVSDEVHADLVYPGQRYIPFALRAPPQLRLVTALSQAKTFNMPGMGLSAAVVANHHDREAMGGFLKCLHLNPFNPLTMAAFEAAYRESDDWVDALMVYLEGNRRWLYEALSALPGLNPMKPEGTFLMWVDARGVEEEDIALEKFFVERAGLGLTSGHLFGPGGRGHMRVNFGTRRAILCEAISRLRSAVAQ